MDKALYFPACIAVTLLVAASPMVAQETSSIQVNFAAAAAAIRQQPVMVSVLQDGSVIVQTETVVPASRSFTGLRIGTYDVRVEGAGIVTEVKRSVQVTTGHRLELDFALRSGQGARVTEYATGGLSREEVATRLQRLEATVAELQRAAAARGTGRPN
jgi:hypothetical protein